MNDISEKGLLLGICMILLFLAGNTTGFLVAYGLSKNSRWACWTALVTGCITVWVTTNLIFS